MTLCARTRAHTHTHTHTLVTRLQRHILWAPRHMGTSKDTHRSGPLHQLTSRARTSSGEAFLCWTRWLRLLASLAGWICEPLILESMRRKGDKSSEDWGVPWLWGPGEIRWHSPLRTAWPGAWGQGQPLESYLLTHWAWPCIYHPRLFTFQKLPCLHWLPLLLKEDCRPRKERKSARAWFEGELGPVGAGLSQQ